VITGDSFRAKGRRRDGRRSDTYRGLAAIEGYPDMGRAEIVVPRASYAVDCRSAGPWILRTYAKRTRRVSHRSLDGTEQRAAHRLHRPSSLVLIKKKNKAENGRRDVAKVAPHQAKTSGSLRAIFDTPSA
jgi:hypothetical protein